MIYSLPWRTLEDLEALEDLIVQKEEKGEKLPNTCICGEAIDDGPFMYPIIRHLLCPDTSLGPELEITPCGYTL